MADKKKVLLIECREYFDQIKNALSESLEEVEVLDSGPTTSFDDAVEKINFVFGSDPV